MKIEHLREIGKRLFSEIGRTRLKPFVSESIGKGAGGDRTFPIDKKAEDIIISYLKKLDEPLSIISEEAGGINIKGGGKKVIVDPIDGSKNAITGIPFYCASIAIADGNNIGSISVGYIINLVTGDEFWAIKGNGAFFNGERIQTQKDDTIYLVAYEAQSPKNDIPRIMRLLSESWRTRCLGAMAMDIAYLAYGAVSIFITPSPSRSFDYAAGYLLVKEAGGIFTDINGNSIDDSEIGLKKGSPLLACANSKIHERALKLLW